MPRRCDNCGSEMRPPAQETVPYRCGIPDVHLMQVDVHRCPECDNYVVDVPNVEELHRQIALLVAEQPDLGPAEIKFLRKYLGWAQKDLAAYFEVDPATASRWEGGHQPMSKPYQKLLKLLTQHGPLKNDYTLDCIQHTRRFELVKSDREEHWRPRFGK